MKRFLTTLTSMVLLVLLSQVVEAQDTDKEKDKDKVKSKNEEIIIRRKTDKDAKDTIEIRGDEVLVNGKPASEYEDENISITKRRGVTVYSPRTPFRAQGGAWSYDSDNFHLFDDNTAFLGVSTKADDKGAEITQITDESAAYKAGLKKGDIITKIGDKTIDKPEDLTKAIRSHKPDEKVAVTYLRDGKEQKTTATLKSRGNFFGSLAPSINVPRFDFDFDNGVRAYSFNSRGRLGVKAQDTEDGKGVKVLEIDEESAAQKAGLKKDDIITEFDGKAVNDTDALARAAREAREKSSITVKFLRDGKAQTAEIKTPKKLKTTNL